MVIFNSYVKLPEGNTKQLIFGVTKIHPRGDIDMTPTSSPWKNPSFLGGTRRDQVPYICCRRFLHWTHLRFFHGSNAAKSWCFHQLKNPSIYPSIGPSMYLCIAYLRLNYSYECG